jgi:hypothetical protein
LFKGPNGHRIPFSRHTWYTGLNLGKILDQQPSSYEVDINPATYTIIDNTPIDTPIDQQG